MRILRIVILFVLGLILSACILPASRTPEKPAEPQVENTATTASLPEVPSTLAPALTPTASPSPATAATATAASQTAAPSPTTTAAGSTPPGAQFAQIQRVDAQHGWATTWNDWLLLHTTDGGSTWQVVNPPGVLATNFTALDAEQAWVLELNPDPQGPTDVLHRTSDGGVSWQAFATPFHSGALQMLDEHRGWAFSSSFGCAAGTCFFEPYRTADGGAIWTPVVVASPLDPGAEPFYPGTVAIPAGLALTATGWDQLWLSGVLWGDAIHEQMVMFYASRDGGASWAEQRLPLPAGAPADAVVAFVSAPKFVDVLTGCLWAWVQSPSEAGAPQAFYAFFCTEDGGESWAARPGWVPAEYYTAPVDLVSAQVIFTRCLEALCTSRDGARAWQRVESNLAFIQDAYPSLANFDFIDSERGWAIVYTSEMDSAIYDTTDGGQTWTPLPAQIEGRP
jgi:photosystem II stability/assembly factor-like uncharacterized protein